MLSLADNKKKPGFLSRIKNLFKLREFILAFVMFVSFTIISGMFLLSITPVRYNIVVGMVPLQTIAATKDVIDEVTTNKNRTLAAASITPTYKYQDGITDKVLKDLDTAKAQIGAAVDYAKTLDDYSPDKHYTKNELTSAGAFLTMVPLRDYQLQTLLSAPTEELDNLFISLYDAVKNTMQANVTQGQESTAINSIIQIIGYRTDVNLLQNVALPLLKVIIAPNMVIDQAATEEAKVAAMEAVEPVVYKQGQNIVVRGENRVTENQVKMLETLGMLKSNNVNYKTNLGALVVVLCLLMLHAYMMRLMTPETFFDIKRLIIVYLILIISMMCCIFAKLLHVIYLAPILLCAMLMTVTIGHVPALISNLVLSLYIPFLLAVGSNNSVNDIIYIGLSAMVAGTFSALFLKNNLQRVRILAVGVVAALIVFILTVGVSIMISNDFDGILYNALYSIGGTFVSTLLCLGLQPVFESLFNLPTQSRLLDLSNPMQPLLHRLLLEAPGTYHHSIIIANLAEASAEAIGANSLLARVGGYYHDVGKLKRPLYFKENQIGQNNVHDDTEPQVSAAIITAHVRDGLALAKQYRLPPEIQAIVAEHHGNSIVGYFYAKALNRAEDAEDVIEDDFRYDGVPPRTKEGAIVMICDTIEAAIRSLNNPTKDDINAFIKKLIRSKIDDEQLINSPLTIGELDKIAQSCATVLYGVFHERIEYPDLANQKKKKHKAGAKNLPIVPFTTNYQLAETPVSHPSSKKDSQVETPAPLASAPLSEQRKTEENEVKP